MTTDRRRVAGFTLIELMVVVIIIAALAGMVLPRLWPASDDAKKKIAQGDMANIAVGLKLFRLHNDRFPTTEEGLNALLSKPSSASGWSGPYLERKALDPWKREYKYKCPSDHNQDFDLWSQGPDPASENDDVKNWEAI